jgi:hypothetical protein
VVAQSDSTEARTKQVGDRGLLEIELNSGLVLGMKSQCSHSTSGRRKGNGSWVGWAADRTTICGWTGRTREKRSRPAGVSAQGEKGKRKMIIFF